MFTRKLGKSSVQLCAGGNSCPDVLELETGDFAVIGTDITEAATGKFPVGSGCGPNERVVRIPRHILTSLKEEIASL